MIIKQLVLPCWFPFSDHKWTEWQFKPCYRFRECLKCDRKERDEGWHKFGKWTDPYSVNIYDRNYKTVSQERQKRICSDCNEVDERTVGY